ncbi:hydrolase or metal-binding protein [Alcanivorax sp. 1008]|uniref:recombination directionality factor n=1 Tax=Alcanivorax sp. 1008 TaxID=2816853 RepID=UPI001D224A64|nr:hydrolase or metal-binding protein [Alcanivorax sp. 1008]MCC1497948.1 hydrolase or metal-binding protein [Alcanivorax sp. 1008]
MIKGLAITPPILGRISIGRVVEKNGKRLPEKDDQFTITTQVQTQEGWLPHPLDGDLRKQAENGKLRSIPVRMLFNDPDLNLRAEYSLFDRQTGRPICAGNGEQCRRYSSEGVQTLPCPSPGSCTLAQGGNCKPYGRLNVLIGEDDEMGTFVFRTTGYNSIRSLAARLRYYQAVSGNKLACLPLELKLRGKSTTQSFRSAIYYVDITIREGMTLEEALAEANARHESRVSSGYNQAALDDAAKSGFANAAFEYDEDEIPGIVDEFYPEPENNQSSLKTKLEEKSLSV